LQSIGGGRWVAGRSALTYAAIAGDIYGGYATTTTDIGLGDTYTSISWGLASPGILNFGRLDGSQTG
jgi:hypothetical protein